MLVLDGVLKLGEIRYITFVVVSDVKSLRKVSETLTL